MEADFEDRLSQEKADAVAQALDRERQQFQLREVAVREEGRLKGEAEARETLEHLRTRLADAETAKATSEQSERDLRLLLEDVRAEGKAEVDRVKEEAQTNARVVREEAQREALASVQERFSTMERERQTSEEGLHARIKGAEDAKATTDAFVTDLRNQLREVQRLGEEQILKVQHDADERVRAPRTRKAAAAAEAAMHSKVSAAEQARVDAEAKSRHRRATAALA